MLAGEPAAELQSPRAELSVIALRIRSTYFAILFAMGALVICLLLFLREIFLAVAAPRYVPR